jgi:hypothetical protein
MRFAIACLAAIGLLAGCDSGPTEQEQNLAPTGSHPEMTANSAAAATENASTGTGTRADEPASNQGSGANETAPNH